LARRDYDFNRDKIEYLSKINLGVPGGGEWLAVREGGYIYVIDSEKKVRVVDAISVTEQSKIMYRKPWDISSPFVLEFDIMQNIPGTQTGNLAAAFGDYNGDGFDEIFYYSQGTYEDCGILGYNSETDKMGFYFTSDFRLRSRLGPPPVEFTNYQGIDGVMVILKDNMDEEYIWEFWAWDEGSRKYVKLAETGKEDIDVSRFSPIPSKTTETFAETAAESQSNDVTQNSTEKSSMPLWVWFAIGGAAAAGGAVFVIKRKK
jgi:hypothetical protein